MAETGQRSPSLSEFFLADGLLTEDQIQTIWKQADQTGVGFGTAAVKLGLLDELQVAQALGELCHVPYLDLDNYLVNPVIARLIPEHISRRHRLIAINRIVNRLTIAMTDPVNIIAIDDIQLMTGLQVKVVVAQESAIVKTLDQCFSEVG
ncbi:MAG TPA: hypothetical protein PKO06_05640 [Candidatus Ozemobacteraceae bacterium]|nr:hypothetical protein [Candidatus Ozemobacteraceae bacterium]